MVNDSITMYWLHALTPLHVGTGQGLGFIDLPIMREKVTGWPLVPGSAVKGVRRDHAVRNGIADKLVDSAFGRPDTEGARDNAGSLVFTDARLVCLPVRSLYGTFAWVTSPLALQRLYRDLEAVGSAADLKEPDCPTDNIARLPAEVNSALPEDNKLYFEDLDFPVQQCPVTQAWSNKLRQWVFPENKKWQEIFSQRFTVLPDSAFDFLCETGTEVTARIRIEQATKTVAPGALWYEESLPAETILAGMIWCDQIFPKDTSPTDTSPKELLQTFCNRELALQVGGKATIGKGRIRLLFSRGNP